MGEELLLEANNFVSKFKTSFSSLLESKNFVDVTLVCHDGQISAHKVILCAGSSLFLKILKENPHPQPLLYLKGVSIRQLSSLLSFVYAGEVKVAKDELDKFLDTAKELQIEGLMSKETEKKEVGSFQDLTGEKEIKSEPEIVDEYNYGDACYVEEGDISVSMEAATVAAPSTEAALVHVDCEKVKKPHKGSTGGRLLRNPVWDYFVKLDNRSSCMTCGFSLVGYNTSSLIKHLENRHIDTYIQYREKYQIAWNQKMSGQKPSFPAYESERPQQQRVKGRLNKNPVHNFFTREENYSNCNYCEAKMLGHHPTTLTKHLEVHHIEQFSQFRDMYKQAWENKRKTMEVKRDLQEENFEQWNDAFEITYDEETHSDSYDGGNNFIGWSSTSDM